MAIPEHLQAILFVLNLEKHMTAKQIAKALYPDEPIKTTYERVIKQLRTLREKKLLESRHYGREKGILWAIAPHPINKEEGFIPPKRWVHEYKFNHERACGDVFVKFCDVEIFGWEQHKKISPQITPDRTVYLTEDVPTYIEVEMGDRDRVTEKLSAYQQYFRETRANFHVLFLVQQLRDWPQSPHYTFRLLNDFISN